VEFLANVLKNAIATGSLKRIAAFAVGLAIPPLNKQLGIDVPQDQVIAALVFIGGYIVQSMFNSVHARKVGASAEQKIKTADDAVEVLKGDGPRDLKP
jgi:hypothetical protein